MKIGLTLGKYAPLHLGHQLVIETALRETAQLYVLVYDCPGVTDISLGRRADWIRRLYPQVKVIEGVNAPPDVGYTPEIMKIQDDYILSQVKDLNITHFYSSEPYGEHVSKALGAVNRLVDPKRKTVPVSATLIRQDPFAAKKYLSELVYPDLVTNVVLLGAPSTGKTTLAQYLAHEFNTVWMPEYGREYWEKNQKNHRLSLKQLVEIATGHLEREKELLAKARNFLFTDTNVLTTRIFSYYYHGGADPELEALAAQHASRYHHYFLCEGDFPFADTWDRSGPCSREVMQKMIIEDLQQRQIPYTTLSGPVPQRAAQVCQVLRKF